MCKTNMSTSLVDPFSNKTLSAIANDWGVCKQDILDVVEEVLSEPMPKCDCTPGRRLVGPSCFDYLEAHAPNWCEIWFWQKRQREANALKERDNG